MKRAIQTRARRVTETNVTKIQKWRLDTVLPKWALKIGSEEENNACREFELKLNQKVEDSKTLNQKCTCVEMYKTH